MQSPCVPYHYSCLPQNPHLRRENTNYTITQTKQKKETRTNLHLHFSQSNNHVWSRDDRMQVYLRTTYPFQKNLQILDSLAGRCDQSRGPFHQIQTCTCLKTEGKGHFTPIWTARTESHLWPHLTFALPCLFLQTLPCCPCYPCCQNSHHSFLSKRVRPITALSLHKTPPLGLHGSKTPTSSKPAHSSITCGVHTCGGKRSQSGILHLTCAKFLFFLFLSLTHIETTVRSNDALKMFTNKAVEWFTH